MCARQRKEARKDAARQAKYEEKEAARLEKAARKEASFRKKHPDTLSPAPAKKKKRKYQTLEDYLPDRKSVV